MGAGECFVGGVVQVDRVDGEVCWCSDGDLSCQVVSEELRAGACVELERLVSGACVLCAEDPERRTSGRADDAVRSAGEQADGRSRVRTLLETYMASAAEDGALRAALRGHATELGNEVRLAIEESEGPIDTLIAADHAEGSVRDDFSFADFRAVCAAVVSVMTPPAPTDAWHRVLTLVLTGLRPPSH
ncbi:hypothetical protein GCM10009706_34060 [Curtobacterium citreum]|nr:hypothetical protein GCM10009706_34060 [Curtobacterium citreum]